MWPFWVMRSSDVASPSKHRKLSKINKNPNGEKIREELVQKAVNFLSHPSVRDQPEVHLRFLESKGLTPNEIQESLNRISNNDELIITENDPIFILPPVKYEEFLCRLRQPDAIDIRNSFQRFTKLLRI